MVAPIIKGNDQPQIDEVRKQCAESLWFLCTQFLGYKDWDLVHDDVERLLRRPARKKALLLPRNHLKSSIVTIAYTIQQILKNPNIRVLIGNGVWDIARDFLDEIRGHLELSQLKYIFGEFVSARWNADEIIVRQRTKPLKEPTIMTTGVEAETTGGHYDLIILDDLMGLQNSQTPEQREKVKRFRRSMINLLEPRNGTLLEIGTRWHLDDTFAEIMEKELKYYDMVVRQVVENGKVIFPKKFSMKFDARRKDWIEVNDPLCMDYIDHLKASMPLDEFSAQYLNRPFSKENQLFKPEFFHYWVKRPEGLFTVMTVDLAISERSNADQTAIVVQGMDHKYNICVLDYLVGRWKPSEIIEKVFEMRSKWKPDITGMEVNGFQRTIKIACEEEMRIRKDYFPIEEIKNGPSLSKENRIKALEPFYRRNAVFHASWMRGKEFENQLQTFPKGRLDDIIDAQAMGLSFLQPGPANRNLDTREWTWDWALERARENNMPGRGFFDYG